MSGGYVAKACEVDAMGSIADMNGFIVENSDIMVRVELEKLLVERKRGC